MNIKPQSFNEFKAVFNEKTIESYNNYFNSETYATEMRIMDAAFGDRSIVGRAQELMKELFNRELSEEFIEDKVQSFITRSTAVSILAAYTSEEKYVFAQGEQPASNDDMEYITGELSKSLDEMKLTPRYIGMSMMQNMDDKLHLLTFIADQEIYDVYAAEVDDDNVIGEFNRIGGIEDDEARTVGPALTNIIRNH